MANIHEIAKASKRLESLHFGVADYAASTRARTTGIGGVNPDYAVLTDKAERRRARGAIGATCGTTRSRAWWSPRVPTACGRSTARSATLPTRTASGPQARRAAVLGCEGKWAIHPSQVALANEVFTPPRQGGRPRPPHPGRHGAGGQGRQGRGEPGRPADRHRLDPAGRGAGHDSRPDRGGRLRRPARAEVSYPLAPDARGGTARSTRPKPRARMGGRRRSCAELLTGALAQRS